MQAQDIMTRQVVTIGLDTPVPEIAQCLIAHRISGVPVVDAEGRVVGIVTEGDLCRRVELGTQKHQDRWVGLFNRNAALATDYVHAFGRKAQDVMTRKMVLVAPDLPISEIADVFETYRIKRVPVVEDGRLVGIVSRANLIQALATFQPAAAPTTPNDRQIREILMQTYASQPWGKRAQINVFVTGGVAHLWGLLDTAAARDALRVAAETTPGVTRVEDHTSIPVYS
jgi:CBS domain-containing protein